MIGCWAYEKVNDADRAVLIKPFLITILI